MNTKRFLSSIVFTLVATLVLVSPAGSSESVTVSFRLASLTPLKDYDEVSDGTGSTLYVARRTIISDMDIARAKTERNPTTGNLDILIYMTTDGEKKFADLTGANVGAKLAIFINGKLMSAPVIRERISEGVVLITGDALSASEARKIVRKLNDNSG